MARPNQDRDQRAEQPATERPAVEQDSLYLAELIDELTAAHPNLTSEEARAMSLVSVA